MILFSIGLPSRFAEWCDFLSLNLAQRTLGEVAAIAAETLDDLAIAVIKTRATHLVIGSRQPVTQLSHAVAGAGAKFIVALDDPRFALYDLVRHHGVDLVEAVRIIARSCASMIGVSEIPGALVLRSEGDWGYPLAAAIAGHFDLAVSEADLAVSVETLPAMRSLADADGFDAWWTGLDEPQRAVANGALAAYVSYFAGEEFGPVTWERDLFILGDEEKRPHEPVPATRPIDITGRSRFLIYGPYLALPPGSWLASITLGFSPEAAEMSYLVEIGAASAILATTTVAPRGAQSMEVNLAFAIDQSVGGPLDVRILNERAAFDGRLALGYVTLSPRGQIRNDALKFFASALDVANAAIEPPPSGAPDE